LVTVIDIEAKQYAKIEIGGLFVIFESGSGKPPDFPLGLLEARKGSRSKGEDRPLKFRISISGILML
jgi:hypothetical protein